FQKVRGRLVHVRLKIVVGFHAAAIEDRVVLYFQCVSGNMFRIQIGNELQSFPPVVDGLPGQTEHQIDVQIIETRGAGIMEGSQKTIAVVQTSQGFQQLRLRGLKTKTQSVDSDRAERD